MLGETAIPSAGAGEAVTPGRVTEWRLAPAVQPLRAVVIRKYAVFDGARAAQGHVRQRHRLKAQKTCAAISA